MPLPQESSVYRYFRIDADSDISHDALTLSLDQVTYVGADYVPAPSARLVAINASEPPASGMTAYWWRVLTGPGQPLPLAVGMSTVYGRLVDYPEDVRMAWSITIGPDD